MTYLAAWRMEGALAVVVGGGPVGARKARGLLAAGARVRVVAPEAAAAIRAADARGRIEWRRRRFRPADLAGAALAFAATNVAAVNRAVAAAARRRRIPVNVADSSAPSDFFVPAVRRRGRIVLGVSTGGADPALAARLARAAARAIRPSDVRTAGRGRRRLEPRNGPVRE